MNTGTVVGAAIGIVLAIIIVMSVNGDTPDDSQATPAARESARTVNFSIVIGLTVVCGLLGTVFSSLITGP
ncbi:MAG TPA: hypothetical protein VLF67_02610 [Candidatus Saccharimonas sp.]|nr:hypothetical protein [Candidatus Saccharimonas sp.]